MKEQTARELALEDETTVTRQGCEGLVLTRADRDGYSEHHVTLTPREGESPAALMQRGRDTLTERAAALVHCTVLGATEIDRDAGSALRQTLSDRSCPVAWIQGTPCDASPVSGIQLYAVSGIPTATITLDGAPAGVRYEDRDGEYLFVGDLQAAEPAGDPAAQASSAFARLESLLTQADMVWSDVVRTWLYLDRITSWYGDFNRVRNALFERHGLFQRWTPASTGIGGAASSGASIVMGGVALKPKHDEVRVRAIPSPLQCPAPAYGSAFSRASEVRTPDLRRVYISGTASIDADGSSMYPGDPQAQIERTLDVVRAILDSQGMNETNISRATAYVKYPEIATDFERFCIRNELTDIPAVVTCCDVCRDDLLFELEVDALAANQEDNF